MPGPVNEVDEDTDVLQAASLLDGLGGSDNANFGHASKDAQEMVLLELLQKVARRMS